jgi:integrase
MALNTLTDARCKAAKPAEKAQKIFDGGGLFLWVSPKGGKTWRLAYRLAGKQQQIGLGEYPIISLSEARSKRDEIKSIIEAGGDPMAPRKAKKIGMTVEEATNGYWATRKDISESYRQNGVRAIEMYMYPRFRARSIESVSRDDVLDILRGLDSAGKHVYVRKLRMWLSMVWDWAVENGYASSNPPASINPRRAFGAAAVQNLASLDIREVPEFLGRLSIENQGLQSVLACRLLALTWVRTNELRLLQWDDIDGEVIRIPAGRMKRKRDHMVPLSRQALDVLAELRTRWNGSIYVFPSDRTEARPMSENAVLYLLHRMGYKGRMTGHGWRSVASTWANEAGYDKDWIERQLAHAPDDKVRAAYNRAEYLPQRRDMLQAWADWLASCEVDAGGTQGGDTPADSAAGD